MLHNKSPQVHYHPQSKTLMLDFNASSGFHPSSTRLFPHRTKKLQSNEAMKRQKAIKFIQQIATFYTDRQKEARQQSLKKRFLHENGKISAYLQYKKEQQIQKMNHFVKNNNNTKYLKKRNSNTPHSLNHQYYSQTFQRSPKGKTINMSKINLELTPSKKNSIKSQKKVQAKGRQFYIKTSQGKRKRVTASDYQSQIKSRATKSQNKNYPNQFQTSGNDFSENHFVFTLNQLSPQKQKPKTSHTSRQLAHYKNRSNALLMPKDQEIGQKCRPWTSHKSDYQN